MNSGTTRPAPARCFRTVRSSTCLSTDVTGSRLRRNGSRSSRGSSWIAEGGAWDFEIERRRPGSARSSFCSASPEAPRPKSHYAVSTDSQLHAQAQPASTQVHAHCNNNESDDCHGRSRANEVVRIEGTLRLVQARLPNTSP